MPTRTVALPEPVMITYVGTATLSAIGGATARRYCFAQSGCTLPVDPRDAAGMLSIPKLRLARRA